MNKGLKMTPQEAMAKTMLAPHEDTPAQRQRAMEAAADVIAALQSLGFDVAPIERIYNTPRS